MDNLKSCSFKYELDEQVTVIFSGKGYRSPESFIGQNFSNNLKVFHAEQTHGSNISIIQEDFLGPYKDSDALVTSKVNCALTIRTADCVPIMLFDQGTKSIAAIHSGLSGTILNIVGKTIQQMISQYGSNPSDIQAFIGPCIHKCCYEVDTPVIDRIQNIPFYKELITQVNNCHYMLDLPLFNKLLLRQSNIEDHNIFDINMCTKCKEYELYSYRRDHCTDRMYSVIVRESM